METIAQTFLRAAREDPRAPLVRAAGDARDRGALAAEAQARSEALRRALAKDGRGAGAAVALVGPAGPGFLACYLACRLADACPILIDAGTPASECGRIASEVGACGVWRPRPGTAAEGFPPEWHPLSGDAHFPGAACVRLTSGSTGDASGIVVSEGAARADADAIASAMRLSEEDRLLAAIPLTHAYGFSVLACTAFLHGTQLVFPPSKGREFEAAVAEGATVWPTVPAWYEAQLAAARPRTRVPGSVRLMISAGAPLRAGTARRWREAHGHGVHVLYGSSECGSICFDRSGTAAERGTVGTPMDGVRVETDAAGVITVISPAVAERYHPDRPPGDSRIERGRFVSADLGEFVGEELRLLGRMSDWVNVKGHKVHPREVEEVLARMPGVRDVAVVGRTLPGGGGESLRAVLVREDPELGFRDVVRWCRSRLGRHKIPRSIAWVEAIPRTSRGKLDREALMQI